VLGLPEIAGYLYDVQITTSPITDGSLSSCPPAEAVTWGKVDKDNFRSTTESVPADYSMVMPFIVKALLEKRARFERWAEKMGRAALFAKHPAARGYLRDPAGYRLYDRREELITKLFAAVKKELPRLRAEGSYALATNSTPKSRKKPAAAPKPARKR
jgi:deoxyhypusine synthase